MEKIQLVVCDDHRMFAEGIALLLSCPEINVAGVVTSGPELFSLLETTPADTVLVDVNMSGMDGIQVTQHLHRHYPDVKILGVSMFKNKEIVKKLLSAGASGYVMKSTGRKELVEGIKTIHEGELYLCTEIAALLNSETEKEEQPETQVCLAALSLREREILDLIIKGLTNAEIGEQLFISPRTASTHRTNLLRKTGARNTAELVRLAIAAG